MKDRNDRDPRNYDSRKTKANSRSKSYPATDSIRETKRNAYPLTNDPQRQYNSDSTQRYYNDSTQRQYNGSNAPYNGSTSQYNGSNAYYNGSSTQYNGSTAQYNGSTAQYNGSSTQYNGSTAQYNGSNTQRQYGSTLPFGRIADVVDQYKTAASSNDRRYYDANNSSRRYNGEVLLDVPSLPGNSRTARNGGDPYAPNFSMGDVVQLAKEEHDKNKKRGFFSNFKRSRSPERTLPQYTAPNSYRMIQGQPTIAKVNPYGYVTRNTVGSYHSTGYYDQGYQPPEVHGTGYYKGKGGYNYPPEPEFTHYEKYIEEPKSYSVSDVAGFVVDNRDKKGKNKTAKDLPPPTRTTQLRYDTVEGTNFDSLMMSNPREARNGSTLNNTGYVVNGSTTNAYRDPSYRSTAYNVTRDSRDRNAAYTTQNYYDGKVVSNARDAYERTTVDKPRSVSGMNTVSGANTVPSMNTVSGGNTVTYPRTVPDGVSSKVTDNAVKFNVARDGNSLGTSTQAQEISTLAQQQTRNIGGQALPEGSQSMQVNNVPPPADGRMSAIREEKEPFPPNGKTKNDSSETAVNDAGTNSDTKDTGGPEIKDAGDQPSKDAGDAETESTGDQKIEDNGEMKPDDGGDPEKKEAEHLENTSAGSSQTKETVDTVTNEVTDSKTISAGGLRANSAGGSRVNSAGGSKTNSAGDSKVNSAEGSKVNSAGGSRANSSRGSKTNSAGGSRANSAGGSKSNRAGGSRANSAGSSKTNSAGGSEISTSLKVQTLTV
ncbi:dentin sialophosphoprotein-like [Macrobrachium rosenbergii]|uniref:dentin sialophosphoprotein-like n=1 Tax=Macrobrachium rosenbergii TaxID=79674 RepID=UPI0034D3C2A7